MEQDFAVVQRERFDLVNPNIYILHSDDSLEKLTDFGYNDFKYRLGRIKK